MKKKIFKRGMAGLLAVLTAFTTLIGMGTTAFAASETAESYMVSYPRDGDAVQVYDQSTWGHSAKTYMNGWSTQSSNVTTIHCMDSYDGKICYCIEPGVPRNVGDSYSGLGENFWDNYPSQYNNTIEPDDIKVLLGRIMQYGYQGNISTSWKSQNAADADKMAHAIATQLLVWETVIGERDADFNHVSTGGKDAVKSVISSGHPLKSRIDSYYNSIVSSVQSHVEYKDGAVVEIEITNKLIRGNVQLTKVDANYPDHHLSGAEFEVYQNGELVGKMEELADGVYEMDNLPYGEYTVKETKAPEGFYLDEGTYAFSIKENGKTVIVENEAGKGFINKAQVGNIRIEKTSEDGVLKGFTFRVEGSDITGNAFSKDFVTDENGQIHIEGLRIGNYVISEVGNKANEKYVLPENVTVTVHEGKTVVAKFYNELKPVIPDVPKTGDTTNMPLWAALAGISLLGAGVAAFFTFRKKKEVGKHER